VGRCPVCLRFVAALCLCGLPLLSSCISQSQTPPPRPAPPALEFLGEWGTRGEGPGKLSQPCGIAADTFGNVYITDSSTQFIQKFSRTGEPLQAFQDPALKQPCSIAVDSAGAIYVTDKSRSLLIVALANGDRHLSIGRIKAAAAGMAPVSVADDGSILVADVEGGTVRRFTARARLITRWGFGKDGSSPRRAGALTFAPSGEVFLAEPSGGRLQAFSSGGAPLRDWTVCEGAGVSSVAASPTLVFTACRGKLNVWKSDGAPLGETDLAPRVKIPDSAQSAIVAYAPSSELFVLFPAETRVLRYRVNLPE